MVCFGTGTMSADLPDFLRDKRFRSKSSEEVMGVVKAALAFHLHQAVSTEQASLLFKFDFVKMNSLSKPEIRSEPFQYIWFTTEGERLAIEIATEMAKEIGVSEMQLKSEMPDFIEDAITDFNVFGVSRNDKFLLHRYRLEKELAVSWQRATAIAEIYAIWF
jgi:hypothetical protein